MPKKNIYCSVFEFLSSLKYLHLTSNSSFFRSWKYSRFQNIGSWQYIRLIFLWFPDTQQADYHFIPSITYRANGAVSPTCLRQYTDLLGQYYSQLDMILTQRCSAVNVNMNVTFLESKPSLLDDNVVQVNTNHFWKGKFLFNVVEF